MMTMALFIINKLLIAQQAMRPDCLGLASSMAVPPAENTSQAPILRVISSWVVRMSK